MGQSFCLNQFMLILQKNNKGFSITEILIAIFIIGIAFVSFLGILFFSLRSSGVVEKANRANFLAQESVEAIRAFRDSTTWDADGLGSLGFDIDYYPSLTGIDTPSWSMVLGQEDIGIFTRKIVFQRVSRDPLTFDIEPIYNSSNHDPDTVRTIVSISFDSRSIELTTYFTNWQK